MSVQFCSAQERFKDVRSDVPGPGQYFQTDIQPTVQNIKPKIIKIRQEDPVASIPYEIPKLKKIPETTDQRLGWITSATGKTVLDNPDPLAY